MTILSRQPVPAERLRVRVTSDSALRDEATPDTAQPDHGDRTGARSLRSALETVGPDSRITGRCWGLTAIGSVGSLPASRSARVGDASELGLEPRRIATARVIDEFTSAWERGEAPAVEAYLDRLDATDPEWAVELIYRAYCLAELDGKTPDSSAYLNRFARYRVPLERLLQLHDACSPSLLNRWLGVARLEAQMPQAGDSIGPYRLGRELGRGAFARVFLAEQTNLADRLVVVKVSARMTREPWLLARAQHAHIVEIVSHALVNDGAFQLICMPFWGGATLSSVLERRRMLGRRAVSGRDLLADLDSVAAPEYPAVHAARPARALLASVSYAQALAWVVARLAEALDHAYRRNVAHGDVKPSNILLSADGNPMLLDFNLARDGVTAGTDRDAEPDRLADPGGTLAYMAPERLWKLTAHESTCSNDDPGHSEFGAGQDLPHCLAIDPDLPLSELAPHRADLYALGMVLLEALSGQRPALFVPPDPVGLTSRRAWLRSAARAYALARDHRAHAIIRDSEQAGGQAIPPGLRTILQCCLEPEAARRYQRGTELAEDLDRWRTQQPLAFALEPFWQQTIPRWLRRQRRMLAAAALSMAVGLVTTAVVWHRSNQFFDQDRERAALDKLARHWDDPAVRTYSYSRRNNREFLLEFEKPQVVEAARRALRDYDILDVDDGPAAGDWRRRDSLRCLPANDREDLELWLIEQAYRYCRALDDRPRSPADWRRALAILDRATDPLRIPAFDSLRRRLTDKLGTDSPPALHDSRRTSAPPWVDEYFLGLVAESEREPAPLDAIASTSSNSADLCAILGAQTREQRQAAERALKHYQKSLALRVESFWVRYRAAGTAFGLGRCAEAASHLEQSLQRRPENAVLRGQLAGCLIALEAYPEALEQCDQALAKAPEHAEFYRTRAFIRAILGQHEGLRDDLKQFEMLSRILPRTLWDIPGTAGSADVSRPGNRALPRAFDIESPVAAHAAGRTSPGASSVTDRGDLDSRTELALIIQGSGAFELADAEAAKILVLDPGHLAARWLRVMRAIEGHRFDEIRQDLDLVLNHAELENYVRTQPNRLTRFHWMTNRYLIAGSFEEARMVARRAVDLAIMLRIPMRGSCHFYLARALAMKARSDPEFVQGAAEQLYLAIAANAGFREWYRQEGDFDPVRSPIDAALKQMEDPATVRSRLASRSLTP
jgi:serine/threonine protein kinase/tetratricopeptide (TPR) repeat protein